MGYLCTLGLTLIILVIIRCIPTLGNVHQDHRYTPWTLLCSPKTFNQNNIITIYCCSSKKSPSSLTHHWATVKTTPLTALSLILILSGDIQSNPGPRPPKYPCGICSRAVRNGQDGIQCDQCDIWHHRDCMQMCMPVYVAMQNPDISRLCGSIVTCQTSQVAYSPILYWKTTTRLPPCQMTAQTPLEPCWTWIQMVWDYLCTRQVQHHVNPQRRAPPLLTILSLNCNSIKGKAKNCEFLSLIDQHDPHIILGC